MLKVGEFVFCGLGRHIRGMHGWPCLRLTRLLEIHHTEEIVRGDIAPSEGLKAMQPRERRDDGRMVHLVMDDRAGRGERRHGDRGYARPQTIEPESHLARIGR